MQPRSHLLPFASLQHAISGGLLCAAFVGALDAQPVVPGTTVDAAYSFSAASDAEFAGATSGEIEVNAFAISAQHGFRASEQLTYNVGFLYRHFAIDASEGVPVSDELRAAALDLGVAWKFAPDWSLSARVQPGIYADGESFDSDGFNVPGSLIASWRMNDAWMFFGGAAFDMFAEDVVLPVFGARWQATPDIMVSLGAPRTEVAYRLGEGRSVFLGASVQGGAFHTDDPAVVSPPGHRSLRDTEVTYREIRVGAGVRWPLTDACTLELEGGWMVDRRFDYDDRDLTVKTDDAAYGRIFVSTRF